MLKKILMTRLFFAAVTVLAGVMVEASPRYPIDAGQDEKPEREGTERRARIAGRLDQAAPPEPEKKAAIEKPSDDLQSDEQEMTLEHHGKRYVINFKDLTVRELKPRRSLEEILDEILAGRQYRRRSATEDGGEAEVVVDRPRHPRGYYQTGLRLINLPTATAIPKGALWIDYTQRSPSGETPSAATLFGLHSLPIPSFGLIYGITDRVHVGAYRSPSDLGRPIMLFAGANLLSENHGQPVTLMARAGLEGRDNFQRNFAPSFELTAARSVTRSAQIYLVPTITIGDRPFNLAPGVNAPGTVALAVGAGGTLKLRPSVALMAEANYRLNQEARYQTGATGIHRPVFGFGLQKASVSRRHTFSLIFTNGQGTTMSQRSMSSGLQSADDGFRGLTIGFNLTSRLFSSSEK